jgi:hypothetical protein
MGLIGNLAYSKRNYENFNQERSPKAVKKQF